MTTVIVAKDVIDRELLADKNKPGMLTECMFKDGGGRTFVVWDIANVDYPACHGDKTHYWISFHLLSTTRSWGHAVYAADKFGGIENAEKAAMADYEKLLVATTLFGRPPRH